MLLNLNTPSACVVPVRGATTACRSRFRFGMRGERYSVTVLQRYNSFFSVFPCWPVYANL